MYVNVPTFCRTPIEFCISTSTVPGDPAGAVAVRTLADLTEKDAGLPPKRTPATPVKPQDVSVTLVPPL
jgi:hypothetical protein